MCEHPFIRPTPSLMGEDIVCKEQFQFPFFSGKEMFALQRVSLKRGPALLHCPGAHSGVRGPSRVPTAAVPSGQQEKNKQTRGKTLRLLIPAFTGPFSHTVWTGNSGKLRHRRWGQCGGSLSDQNSSRKQTPSEKTPSGPERSGVPPPAAPPVTASDNDRDSPNT